MIPFLRPCRAAAPRMTGGRPPVPGPCGRRAAAGSRSRGRPVQGMAHPPCGDGFPLPRASRTRSRWPCICTVASRSRGRPAQGVAHPPCGDGLPLPRASRTRSRWPCICTVASRSRGRPARGVAHPPCGDGLPLPRASRTRSRWPCICTVASRSRGRPAQGVASSAVRLCAPARASPAASPVRPCAGAVLRPPHFHHSIWKANDKPAPPNVMISLRFPAAGAERGAPGAACSTAFALRGRGFRRTESSAGQPRLLRPARTRFSRRPAERFCAASPPAQKAGRSRPATCSPIPAGAAACAFLGVRQAPPRGRPGAFC